MSTQELIEAGLHAYKGKDVYAHTHAEHGALKIDLASFFRQRLQVMLRDEGYRYDLIKAILQASNDDDVLRIVSRIEALQTFMNGKQGELLVRTYMRTRNIIRGEQGNAENISVERLCEDSEIALYKVLNDRQAFDTAIEKGDFYTALKEIAKLQPYTDRFFDEVMVNAEDEHIKANRMAVLAKVVVRLEETVAMDQIVLASQ